MSDELEQELLWVVNHEEVVSTPLKREEIIEIYKEIERLDNENERYRIAINEMAIIISKAIEHIEKSWNDKCTIPIKEVGYSTDIRWEIWKILKGNDKE